MPGKIGVVLQARMGSTRLPGKVLKDLCGKPMLAWIFERLRLARRPDAFILATSDQGRDDPVAALAPAHGFEVFRGSEGDVLDRYYQCARQFGLDFVVRATADNPFVDPEGLDGLLDVFLARELAYACADTKGPSGYPWGVGQEVFTLAALERSWREGHEPHHREHVDEYILERPDIFPQAVVEALAGVAGPGLSLTVDTPEDFARAEAIYAAWLAIHPGRQVDTAFAVEMARRMREGA